MPIFQGFLKIKINSRESYDINMQEDNIISDSLTDTQSDGTETASAAGEVTSIKDVLGKTLGKEFNSDEAALKSVKDTFKYVGMKEEQIAQKIKADLEAKFAGVPEKLSQLEKQQKEGNFYAEHPEYKPYRDVVSKYGDDPEKVIADTNFQEVFSKIKAYDENANSKSVIHSNTRLGVVKDSLEQAKQAQTQGNQKAAEALAVKAVNDAYSD